ncbi:unnamed protein product [Brachionus calyciflorus]|uniref:Uncharacterized protein n=1 Tax=Brachionus calyciflorus TaxID=104777 RepID=A0A814DM96_9BILA|nr:unnamed protein product [Brachionus calyciflorus]
MNELEIVLPCGFTTKYSNLPEKDAKFRCIECKSHLVDLNECLNMPRNWTTLKNMELDHQADLFKNFKQDLDIHKKDPDMYIKETLMQVCRDMNTRRDEIKESFNIHVDNYYEKLKKEVVDQFTKKRNKFVEDLKIIEVFEKEFHMPKVEKEFDFNSQKEILEKNLSKLQKMISYCRDTLTCLKKENVCFITGDDELITSCVERIFGKLSLDIVQNRSNKCKKIRMHRLSQKRVDYKELD